MEPDEKHCFLLRCSLTYQIGRLVLGGARGRSYWTLRHRGREEGGVRTRAEGRRRVADYVNDCGPTVPLARVYEAASLQFSGLSSCSACDPSTDASYTQLPPEHGLRQPRYPQMGRDCAAFPPSGSRDSAPRSPSVSARPVHGFSSANRPLTSRLLMVLLCVLLPCHGTSASLGSTVKRHPLAPSQFLEFHNSRHFSLCASPSVRLFAGSAALYLSLGLEEYHIWLWAPAETLWAAPYREGAVQPSLWLEQCLLGGNATVAYLEVVSWEKG